MIAMEWDFKAMFEALEQTGEDYRDALDKGFARAGIAVVHRFQDNQLSGRKSGDIGLNVRTGNLRDSIKSLVTTEAGRVEGTVFNQGAQYWYYHQNGMGHNPKRLFFDEDFADSGMKLYESAVDLAFQAVT